MTALTRPQSATVGSLRAAAWSNRWLGAGAAAAIGAVTALLSAGPMPRGPVTGNQAFGAWVQIGRAHV